MVVERMVMADAHSNRASEQLFATSTGQLSQQDLTLPSTGRKVFIPPEWAPWGLLSAGALVVLYSAALKPGEA